MPSGYQYYILRGFSEELDLRPLHFVDPLPPARICSACGHVSKRTGALLCGHFLCGLCYQQCGPDGGRTCPFDGEACPEETVQWRDFPAEQLLKKQVNCWNKANGCSVTTAASELPRHFYRECEHHSTFCPKCSTKVLCKSLCSHIRSCAGSQRPSSAETAFGPSGDQQCTGPTLAVLSTATLQMQQQLDELKAGLKRISLEELSRDVNNLGETLKQDLQKFASDSRDNFSRHAADIDVVKDKVAETGKEVVKKIEVVLRHTMKQLSHEWTLKGYASLKNEATKKGSSVSNSNPVYLCGYLLLLGVDIKKAECSASLSLGVGIRKADYSASLALHMHIRLGKGEVDEYLQWPFQKKVVLSVVHPKTGEKHEQHIFPSFFECYSMPTTAWNQICYSNRDILLSNLECWGYVKDDQLQLRVALVG
ncbi:hypothetical protein HPB48_003318 [Haemaphysalis longicornis]|uniref:TRAF1-6 MATH domain-containing protein n=1 Tax=Haemaphysalis longicornis TaxID=44386 RepID=A0A9J6GZQ9_HAELO|nr:hypothetical protein HPB48_003318 [Haemaphysalis longicornis]